jgi:glycosyltransferase involved in cell wall biosynthesis
MHKQGSWPARRTALSEEFSFRPDQVQPPARMAGRHVLVLASNAGSLINFRGPLLKQMVKNGWRVTAAAPGIEANIRVALEGLGVEAADIEMQRAGINPVADLTYFRRLRDLIRRTAPDALVAYTAKPVIWGSLAAPQSVRVVGMITGLGFAFTPPQRLNVRYLLANIAASILYWLALRRVDHALFQNPDDRAMFLDRRVIGRSTPTTVMAGSGVDLDYFRPVPLPAAITFVMVARLLAAKGVREFAGAALGLKAQYPHVEFHLVGGLDPGPDAVPWEEVETWKASGLVCVGSVADVRPEIGKASCIVLPSYREGTPRSVLEGMAMGRPVITSDAPGCRETVVDGVNGWLVPPRETAPLAAAMERFILNPGLLEPMGLASLDLARRKYDVHLANGVVLAALEGHVAAAGPKPGSKAARLDDGADLV